MAPVNKTQHDVVEESIKHVIEDLYNAMVQVHAYDTTTASSRDVLQNTLKDISQSLRSVHKAARVDPAGATGATANITPTAALPSIPADVIQYIDAGRNPDIYTREFVEGTRKHNQLMKGKMVAFTAFRDVLAVEMSKALPELADDVQRVVSETGGAGDTAVDDVRASEALTSDSKIKVEGESGMPGDAGEQTPNANK